MVIERFVHGATPVYERAAEQGRMLPDGLVYVDSWIDESLERCFQLIETYDPALFDEWIVNWSDLGEFEVVAVIGSAEASARALDA
jgi:alpha-L-fucosidase